LFDTQISPLNRYTLLSMRACSKSWLSMQT